MPCVELKRLWVDDDGMLSLSVTASNGRNSNTLETYIYPEQLLEFADRLERFPTSRDDAPLLESGGPDPKWHDFLRIRASLRDAAGHSALEFHMETRGAPPAAATSHFYLSCNPGDVNTLGVQVREWLQNPLNPMCLEWRDES
jgi:hypothetical protein